MTRIDKRELLIIAICIAAILLGSSLYQTANAACAKGIEAAKELGCLEFWANRYQSLISAALALVAAIGFGIPAWKNLAAVNRQVTLGNLNFGAALIAERERDISAVGDMVAIMTGAMAITTSFPIESVTDENKLAFIAFLEKHFDPIQRTVDDLSPRGTCWGSEVTAQRTELFLKARDLISELIEIKQAILRYGSAANMNEFGEAGARAVSIQSEIHEKFKTFFLPIAMAEHLEIIAMVRSMHADTFSRHSPR